jgi:tetratricopeptide (TPR) repeat protein
MRTLIYSLLLFSAGYASYLDEANKFYSSGKIPDALPLYKKAVRHGENPTLCYFNLANAYYRLDSVAQAIVYYKASIAEAPEFFKGRLNLAVACFALDELAECITYATQALSLEPDNQKALLTLAAAYRKARAVPEAITAFERLARRFPEMEEPYVALGELYRELDDPQEAVKWFEQYPRSGKNYPAVLLFLADISESGNDLVRARYYLRKSFEKDTTKQWTYYRLVTIDEKAGNELVALEEAEDGVEQFPRFAEIALLAGTIAFKLEKFDKARRYFEIARINGSARGIIGLNNLKARLHEQ